MQKLAASNKKQKSIVDGTSTKNTTKSNDKSSKASRSNDGNSSSSKSLLDETEAMREQITRMATRDPSMYARLRKSGLVEDVGIPDEETDAAEALEGQMLRYYEKRLKIKKIQKLPKSFDDDGLDFLLEDIAVGSKIRRESTNKSTVITTNAEVETTSDQVTKQIYCYWLY